MLYGCPINKTAGPL